MTADARELVNEFVIRYGHIGEAGEKMAYELLLLHRRMAEVERQNDRLMDQVSSGYIRRNPNLKKYPENSDAISGIENSDNRGGLYD